MWQIGIWEQNEGLYDLAVHLAEGRATVAADTHPAQLAGTEYDLLVVSPRAVGWAGGTALYCRTALLPGPAGPLARALRAERAVSYGLDPRDTLTLSSLDGEHICVAVQRELIRLDGGVAERQELVLPYDGALPELALVRAGMALLLGGDRADVICPQ